MNKRTTRQRILQAALNLFAEKGYGSVRVAEIADRVGIKAPSLYKHYKSKQSIFDALLEEMALRYKIQMEAIQMDGQSPEKDVSIFANMDENHLQATAKGLFNYYLHDEFAAPFRRMLAIEQFHNPHLAALYTNQYIEDPLSFQGSLFQLLITAGHMKPENSRVMAMQFYGPIFMLLTLCDCQPEMEKEALSLIEMNITHFEKLYRINKSDTNHS